MSDERLPIDRVIALWKADCGIERESDNGTTYLVVPIPDRRGRFLDLVQAMVHFGHSEEDIRSATVSTKVVMACWSDLIVKISDNKLKKYRGISRNQWEEAVDEFFVKGLNLPKYIKPIDNNVYHITPPKKEKTKEEMMDDIFNPKDRIVSDKKIDRTNDINWELLAELGIEPDGSGNE